MSRQSPIISCSLALLRAGVLSVSGLLLLFMSLVMLANSAVAAIGEIEPNNDKATAQAISLGTEYIGVLQNLPDPDYDDYYKFTLDSASNVTLVGKPQVGGGNASNYWNMEILDPDTDRQILYFSFNAAAASGQTRQIGLPAGTYYVHISNYYSVKDIPYLLTVSAVAGEIYEQELNDGKSTAQQINLGVEYQANIQSLECCNTDRDYYKFTLNSISNVTLSGKPLTSGGNAFNVWSVEFYEPNTDQKILSFLFNASESSGQVRQIGLPAGTYYIQITGYSGDARNIPYLLKVSAVTGGSYEQEINDSKTTAQPISLGVEYLANIQGGRDCCTYDTDHYKFTLNSASNVTLLGKPQIGGGNASNRWDIVVYDANTDTQMLDFRFDASAASGQMRQIGLPAGTYYVKVSNYSNILDIPYLLKVSAVVGTTYEQELNDSKITAQLISLGVEYRANIQFRDYATDNDYYKFTLTSASNVTLIGKPTIGGNNASSRWNAEVFDTNTDTQLLEFRFDASAASGQTRQIGLPAGAYYVKVSNYSNVENMPYLLKVSAKSGVLYERELNDSKVTAQPISLGVEYQGNIQSRYYTDYDNYKFTLASTSNVMLVGKPQTGGGSATANWQVEVYNFDTEQKISYFQFDASVSTGRIQELVLPAGTYYVRVSSYSNVEDMPYLLTVNFSAEVSSVLPTAARLDVLQTFTLTGNNLALGAVYSVDDCPFDLTYRPQGTPTQLTFRCTPRLPGSKKVRINGIEVGSVFVNHPARQGEPNTRGIPSEHGSSLWNGNFYHSVVDMTIPGKGVSFVLSRSYNAYYSFYEKERGGVDNYKPWRFNWELSVGYVPNTNNKQVFVQREDGAGENFFKDSDGKWYPIDQGNFDQIKVDTPITGQTTLFTREGLRYTFQTPELGGKLLFVSDHNGNKLTLTYGANGKVSVITDASGRKYTFSYDANNRLWKVADFSGRYVQYTWEVDTAPNTGFLRERIKTVRDVRGKVTTYNYTPYGGSSETDPPRIFLSSIVDPRLTPVVRLTYTKQAYGNWGIQTLQDATDAIWKFGYCAKQPDGICTVNINEAVSFQTTMQSPLTGTVNGGSAPVYEFDNGGRLFAITNAAGSRSQIDFQPADIFTTQTYNTASLPQSSKTELGIVNGYATNYSYTPDNAGNLATTTNEEGETSQYEWDTASAAPNVYTRTKIISPTGAADTFTFTSVGNLASHALPGLTATRREYDNSGLLKKHTDARNAISLFSYDANGNQEISTLPLGVVMKKSYDSLGRVREATDALNRVTKYTYDEAGNTKTVIDPLNRLVQNFYDDNGNLIKTIDARSKAIEYVYNKRNELIKTTATVSGLPVVTERTYDALGRLITVKNANGHTSTTTLNSNGKHLSETDALNQSVSFEYDADDRLIKKTDQDGRVTKTDYDRVGRVVSVTHGYGTAEAATQTYTYYPDGKMKTDTDSDNKTTQYEYDPAGRLVKVIDPNNKITTATYDDNGNQTSVTDPNGNKTTFVYDALNRRTTTTDAKGGVWAREYDKNSNIIKETAPGGLVTTRSFDAANQLKVLTLPGNVVISYNYDANGNRIQMTDATGVTTYEYDELNRLKKVIDPRGKAITYTYDGVGNLKTLGYPGGQVVKYDYDAAERMTGVTDWLNKKTTYTLNKSGQVTAEVLGNGNRVDRTYDRVGRQTSLINKQPNGSIISSHALTLDGRGNITQSTAQLPMKPSLVTLQRALTYDTANRLATFNGVAVNHDAAGRITGLAGNTYNYDGRDLITGISGGQTASFAYNGNGHRISRTLNGETTRYVIDPVAALPNVLAETDSAGAVQRNYVYGYSLLEQIDAANAPHYYHFDPTGHTLALTDGSGTITDTYFYTPFGETTATGNTLNPFRYVGKEGVIDDGNGLHYMRARYYRADIARFMSLDAIEGKTTEPQGLNRYAYVRGNPITGTDPSGRVVETAWDAANCGYGFYSFQDSIRAGNYVYACIDAIGTGLDCAATVTPLVPGGASSIIRLTRTKDNIQNPSSLKNYEKHLQLIKNKTSGDLAVIKTEMYLESNGFKVLGNEVYAKTPSGVRRYDIFYAKNNAFFNGEVKWNGATRNNSQIKKDISAKEGVTYLPRYNSYLSNIETFEFNITKDFIWTGLPVIKK